MHMCTYFFHSDGGNAEIFRSANWINCQFVPLLSICMSPFSHPSPLYHPLFFFPLIWPYMTNLGTEHVPGIKIDFVASHFYSHARTMYAADKASTFSDDPNSYFNDPN